MLILNTAIYKDKYITLPGVQTKDNSSTPALWLRGQTTLIQTRYSLKTISTGWCLISCDCSQSPIQDNYLIFAQDSNYLMFLLHWIEQAPLYISSWGKKRKDALISIPTLLEVLLLHLSHVHYRGWWKQVQLYSLWWNILLKLSFKKRERNSILCMKRIFHFSL